MGQARMIGLRNRLHTMIEPSDNLRAPAAFPSRSGCRAARGRISPAPARQSLPPAIAIEATASPRTITPSNSATTGIRNVVEEARVAPSLPAAR
jgi:hypothetical protein